MTGRLLSRTARFVQRLHGVQQTLSCTSQPATRALSMTRKWSSEEQQQRVTPTLTFDMARDFQENHIKCLENPHMIFKQALNHIKADQELPFPMKWQAGMSIFMTSQAQVLALYNLNTEEYTQQYHAMCQSHPQKNELQQGSGKVHRTFAKEAFGVVIPDDERMAVEQARTIASLTGMSLQDEKFLKKVDAAISALGPKPSDEERQQAMMLQLLPQQMAVASENGFEGDAGYVRLQTLLLEHAADQQLMYHTLSGVLPVFRRAGLNMGGEA
eukprot:m.144228 g.144228  ORF g.144228 m.144228 type:complete len:271 (+) comp14117_c0_seq2:49-861(+)